MSTAFRMGDDTQSLGLIYTGNTSSAGKRRASCEEAGVSSADRCRINHDTYASIVKCQRYSGSSAASVRSTMSVWNKQQERILMALTPQQYCTNETIQHRKIDQGCENSIEWQGDQQVPEDALSLNVDDPRMRYAGVSSLVALFHLDPRKSNNQSEMDKGCNDKLSTLLTCMNVTGDAWK